jgi:spore germination protein
MRYIALFSTLLMLAFPTTLLAAPKFEASGWIPYWRVQSGVADVLPHMQSFTALMPFGYIVQNDGTLSDAFGIHATTSSSTEALLASARANHVRLVPTVMWSNSAAMYTILSSGPSRRALEDRIANLAIENGFDGIDIDFENKTAETRPYFSLFLQGLYARMGNKFVYCSIEPRTPPSSAFAVQPARLEYANDYVAINRYCDRVAIMTYDQGAIDLTLNASANSVPYIPVSDVAWVKKVITLAAKTISKNKILIGIPTYGYEYDLVPLAQGYRYAIDWAFNPRYATELAAGLGLTPMRNKAGEMSFVYQPTTTPATSTDLRIVWWSDAHAIQQKIQLAHTLGVRGIAIFKLDGGEDSGLWSLLPPKK